LANRRIIKSILLESVFPSEQMVGLWLIRASQSPSRSTRLYLSARDWKPCRGDESLEGCRGRRLESRSSPVRKKRLLLLPQSAEIATVINTSSLV
jgi:hypothetical protein